MTITWTPKRWKTQALAFGHEELPVVLVDNVLDDIEPLLAYACDDSQGQFQRDNKSFYPGIRKAAPAVYADVIRALFRDRKLQSGLNLPIDPEIDIVQMYLSMVTLPPSSLQLQQCLPHFDAATDNCFALIHYLCDEHYGGTAFYRHQVTGYECIDPHRFTRYRKCLDREFADSDCSQQGYISKYTPEFTRIGAVPAQRNRAALYLGKSLHTGDVDNKTFHSSDPKVGRLTLTAIIQLR